MKLLRELFEVRASPSLAQERIGMTLAVHESMPFSILGEETELAGYRVF